MVLKTLKKIFSLSSPKYGLAFGGGAARGAAHLGAIKALREFPLSIQAVSGTSSGALIASIYAFEIDIERVLPELKKVRPIEWTSIIFKGPGFFHNDAMEKFIDKNFPKETKIEDSPIPLSIHVTDLKTGRGINLHKGDLKKAILSSCAVPGIYIPIQWDDYLLADGGLTENVPLSALREKNIENKIGINLNGHQSYEDPNGVMDVITNAIDIAIDSKTRQQMRDAQVPINLKLSQFSRFDIKDFEKLIKSGYEQTTKILTDSLPKL